MRRAVYFGASVSAGLAIVAAPAVAGAATISVTGTGDEFGAGAPCTLREAVQAANIDADFGGCERTGGGFADSIVLEGGETYLRSLGGVDDVNASGDLDVVGKLTIEVIGGGKATIDANDLDRVIEVRPGAKLTASKLVIQDATVTGGQPLLMGAGILSQGKVTLSSSQILAGNAPGNSGSGGGIASFGTSMSLKKVTIAENDAGNIGAGIALISGDLTISETSIDGNDADGSGGGIYLGASEGSVEIEHTTISSNTAAEGIGNSGGGGLFVSSTTAESLRATNVTISGNQTNGHGGGIFEFSGDLVLNAATITDNTADTDADGTFPDGGGISGDHLVLKNSIVAGNVDLGATSPAPDCAGFRDMFHTLVGLGTGCDETASNLATADPLLKPLGDNGGSTFTHALKAGSPAIGLAGGNAPAKDQRGVKRDGHPDAGAYER